MKESPLFAKAKAEGKTSKNPLKESFGNNINFKICFTGTIRSCNGTRCNLVHWSVLRMSFLQKVMNLESTQVDYLMATALLMGTPFFVFFGWLSDKVGTKAIMMTGMLVAILAYRPIYHTMFKSVNLESKTVASNGITEKRSAKIHKDIATDSLVTFHKEILYTDGTLMKKDSIVHWSAAGPVIKDGKS